MQRYQKSLITIRNDPCSSVGTIGLEENNGPISLLNLIGKDRAGNALSFSDAQVIMDNNAP